MAGSGTAIKSPASITKSITAEYHFSLKGLLMLEHLSQTQQGQASYSKGHKQENIQFGQRVALCLNAKLHASVSQNYSCFTC